MCESLEQTNESYGGLTISEVISKLKEEDKFGTHGRLKIVLGGKFYDVKAVYSIESDEDNVPYICIDGDEQP